MRLTSDHHPRPSDSRYSVVSAFSMAILFSGLTISAERAPYFSGALALRGSREFSEEPTESLCAGGVRCRHAP